MEFNHRKMLVSSFPPEKGFNLPIFIPCFQIHPPPPPPPPTQTEDALSLIVTTMICILGSVLLFLLLVVLAYLHITQSRRSSAVEASPDETNRSQDGENESGERDHHVWRINTSGLHRSVIDSITVIGFKKGDGIIDGTECSVCLNEFQEDESLRLLPKCRHAFHTNCIDTWLLSHKNCPLCRAPVLLLTETTLHQETESASSNDLRGTRNVNVALSRAQSDLASVETVQRSFSIGGSSSLKAEERDDIVANGSRIHFYSNFSANFFSSSRRSKNQELVLPTQMPSGSS